MSVIQTWFSQDLQKAVKVNHIDGNLFSHNGNGNSIGVRVYNDGEPVTLAGTVSGYVITSDGSTVPCVGARSGNEATITIPPAAYQPGNAFITIFLTDGSTVTTLCAAQTTVLQARTGSQVSPGSVVQDWTQTINAAMQSVEDAAENLGGIIATPYASLTYPVPLGKYTYYNNGLYRCISPIETSEEFTAAHWTQVKLGDDVTELKSALNERFDISENLADTEHIADGAILSDGSINPSVSGYKHTETYIPVSVGQYYIKKISAFAKYDADKNFLQRSDGSSDGAVVNIVSPVAYVRLSSNSSPSLWRFNKGNTLVDEEYHAPYLGAGVAIPNQIDNTLLVSGKAADSKATGDAIKSVSDSLTETDDLLTIVVDDDIIDELQVGTIYNTKVGVGNIVDMTGTTSAQYGSIVKACKAGAQFTVSGLGGDLCRLWCFTDSDYKIISVSAAYVDTSGITITAPSDGYLIYQCSTSEAYPHSLVVLNAKKSKPTLEIEEAVSALDDKIESSAYPFTSFNMFRNIAGLGDSYTEGDIVTSGGVWTTVNGVNYLATIGKRSGVDYFVYGSGGSTTETYQDRPAFANCLSDDPRDLYMINFGLNDADQSMSIGTVADIKEDYTQNPNTFFGNYGKIISRLIAHAPSAKIILMHVWSNASRYIPYSNAVDAIAEHFGIPVLALEDDPFFLSDFWLNYKSGGHPTPMLYAGAGMAIERLFSKCVTANPNYFKYAIVN